jgi:hypothetical protein
MRKFNLGDLFLLAISIKDIADGVATIKARCRPITQVVERVDGKEVVYEYTTDIFRGKFESEVVAARDAKKMVMTMLATRMQSVASMEVPE